MRLTLAAALAGVVAVGCAPEPEPLGPLPPLPTSSEGSKGTPPKSISPLLDAFGNLTGSGKRILGFEMPLAHDVKVDTGRTKVVYVSSNAKRLVRFYKSRGYLVAETPSGYRFEHTERTLAAVEAEVGAGGAGRVRPAAAFATRGPGPGWSLRFDDGLPFVETPPVAETLERLGLATRDAVAGDEAAEPAAAKAKPESAEPKPAKTPGRALPTATGPSRFDARGGKTTGRMPVDPEARRKAIAKRILEWEERTGKEFKD